MVAAPGLCCLWSECPEPGPYADNKTLFEHLQAAHNPQRVMMQCRWSGCTRDSTITGSFEVSKHLCSHADFRPYVCAHHDCGLAVISAHDLRRHIVDQHDGHAQPQTGDTASASCLPCRWAECPRVFSNDNAGASQLWEHIARRHAQPTGTERGLQCRWGTCARGFHNSSHYMPHLRSHLPKWYRPYECTTCGRKFSAISSLGQHKRTHAVNATAPREDDGNGDGGHKGKRKRRRIADNDAGIGRLEDRVTMLEARLDALITGWRKGRGQPGADELDESEEEDS